MGIWKLNATIIIKYYLEYFIAPDFPFNFIFRGWENLQPTRQNSFLSRKNPGMHWDRTPDLQRVSPTTKPTHHEGGVCMHCLSIPALKAIKTPSRQEYEYI